MKPLISIIVPVYNVEKQLQKCIQSITSQTYTNIEIIIVNDGSTDSSGELCDMLASKDERIKVVHKKNGGLVSARNAGLQIAVGSYIGFVDGDDYIEYDMYECLYEHLYSSGADFIHMGYIVERVDGSCSVFAAQKEVISFCAEERLKMILAVVGEELYHSYQITLGVCSNLYNSDFIRKCYACVPEEQNYGEDLICLCKCILEAGKMAMCDQALYHYVKRPGSITMNRSIGAIVEHAGLYSVLCRMFDEYGVINDVKVSLDNFLRRNVRKILSQEGCINGIEIPLFAYPFMEAIIDKKIIIYGAGQVGRDYYAQISKYQRCNIVAWVDRKHAQFKYEYAKVIAPEEALGKEYDFIVLAVKSEEIVEKIKRELLEMGVAENKIKWYMPQRL